MRSIALTILLFVLLLWFACSARAQFCGRFDKLVEGFEREFGEVTSSTGVTKINRIVILSSLKGTFTIVRVYPNGNACVIEYGTDYESYVIKKGKDT